jgi:hypothetical protein
MILIFESFLGDVFPYNEGEKGEVMIRIRYGVSRRKPNSKRKSTIECKYHYIELDLKRTDDEKIIPILVNKHPGWSLMGYFILPDLK